MPLTPLNRDNFDAGIPLRNWRSKNKTDYERLLKLLRFSILGVLLPVCLIIGPVYLRYRVYSEQLYPVAISDQRLIDGRVSTIWCQRQVVKVNTTFNAYLINGIPKMNKEKNSVSMMRHLILEDDMKEYWAFYLLKDSSVTVSTCVRWPGASLIVIRGHKNLHECAFIGDDSSEEAEELLEQHGQINDTAFLKIGKKSNEEDDKSNEPEMMKRVGANIEFLKKKNAPHPNKTLSDSDIINYNSRELDPNTMKNLLTHISSKVSRAKIKQKDPSHHRHHHEGVFRDIDNIKKPPIITKENKNILLNKINDNEQPMIIKKLIKLIDGINNSSEITTLFKDILNEINNLGDKKKMILNKLVDELNNDETNLLNKKIENKMKNSSLSLEDKKRLKRQMILSSPLAVILNNEEDEDEDVAIEEEDLHPDGIAEDRGTINETTLNDRSNSEFWSSFSSSEERLLQCKGLILNLPLTPHHLCSKKFEDLHSNVSLENTITYRVPADGYYFFVFNSENEVQKNYVRIKFDLIRTSYNTSNSIHTCQNSTEQCSLPFNFFSLERTVLELPFTGNHSQWNDEYVVISDCEPRTSIYLLCIISIPLLILFFAYH